MPNLIMRKRIALLERRLPSADASERAAAVQALAALGQTQWGTWIHGDRRDFKRLGSCPDPRVFDWLVEATNDPDSRVAALAGLGRFGDPRAIPHLREALSDADTKAVAARALERLGEPCAFRASGKQRLSLISAEPLGQRIDPNNRPNPRCGEHEDIFDAGLDGDVEAIEAFLAAGVNFDARKQTWILNSERLGSIETGGETPLMLAAMNGHLDAARLLIDRGADVNAMSVPPLCESALALAVEHGDVEMTDLLLGAGARTDQPSAWRHTSLTLASTYGYVGIVGTLLRHGADPNYIREDTGATALSMAAGEGHEEIVDMLLASSATIESPNKGGGSALTEAVFYGRTEVVETLIDAGADVDGRVGDETALMIAAQRGKVEIARILLKAGARKNPRTEIGRSALFMAVEQGDVAMVRLLLKNGANPQAKAYQQRWRDDTLVWFEFTPLMLAAEEGNLKIVRILRKACPRDEGKAMYELLQAGLPLDKVCEMFEIDATGRRRLENFLAGGLM